MSGSCRVPQGYRHVSRKIISQAIPSSFPIHVPHSSRFPSGNYRSTTDLELVRQFHNEDGFRIERRTGTTGTYAEIAALGVNAASYTDVNLANGTTYCYRVRAYNAGGASGYSNEQCATTSVATSYTLTVAKSGTGGGVVTATGINCGADCSELYASGTSVTLTAIPASGSSFAGWSGTGCTTATVTVNGNMTCTANFNLVPGFALTVNVAQQVTTGGSASGRVISNPSGIDCGSDCSENYSSGMVISLTPIPAAGSVFTRWTGDADCTDGSVTMNANKGCTANFAQTNAMLTVTKVGSGSVSSTPSGIDCGSTCSYSFNMGGAITLQATPSAGFTFAGWSGSGCQGTAGCTMTISSNTAVTATFVNNQTDKVGIYRPSTGEWFLDRNGNGIWDGCSTDKCVQSFSYRRGSAGGRGVEQIGSNTTRVVPTRHCSMALGYKWQRNLGRLWNRQLFRSIWRRDGHPHCREMVFYGI